MPLWSSSASGNPAIESFQYDNAQRLKSLTSYADLAAAQVDDHDHKRYWSYDNDGLMLSETVTAKPGGSPGPDEGTQSYTYTSLGQLKSWTRAGTTTDYAYDKAGNRTQAGASTFSFDDQNRLVSGGGATYVWSDRGTMVSRTSGGSTTTYDFDAFAQETRAGSVSYQRDGLGRVSSRNGQALSYTGLAPQVCNDGSTKVSYTPTGDPLAVTSNGSTAWALLDAHSDLVALLSPSTGKVVAHRSYDPYGVPGESTGTMAPSIGYQSDWTDPTTGEVNMGARNYLPAADSFTSRDSYPGRLDTPVSLNRYTYAHNNPLTNLDPTGNSVDVNEFTQSWDQYWAAVGANINEYKRIEFLNGIANGRKAGFNDEQIQFLLAIHFRNTVNPNVARIMKDAADRWFSAHPESGRNSDPTHGNGGSRGVHGSSGTPDLTEVQTIQEGVTFRCSEVQHVPFTDYDLPEACSLLLDSEVTAALRDAIQKLVAFLGGHEEFRGNIKVAEFIAIMLAQGLNPGLDPRKGTDLERIKKIASTGPYRAGRASLDGRCDARGLRGGDPECGVRLVRERNDIVDP